MINDRWQQIQDALVCKRALTVTDAHGQTWHASMIHEGNYSGDYYDEAPNNQLPEQGAPAIESYSTQWHEQYATYAIIGTGRHEADDFHAWIIERMSLIAPLEDWHII